MSELAQVASKKPNGEALPTTPAKNQEPGRLFLHQPSTEEVQKRLATPDQDKVDVLRKQLEQMPQLSFPITNRFTPGLYTREIFMPKDSFIISKIHKTEHPFVVLSGHCAVWIEGKGVVHIKGPYIGITEAGTRRVLYVHEDCRWLTFHPTDKKTVEEVENEIILPHNDVQVIDVIGEDVLLKLKESSHD